MLLIRRKTCVRVSMVSWILEKEEALTGEKKRQKFAWE
jgi:hypothetical protein